MIEMEVCCLNPLCEEVNALLHSLAVCPSSFIGTYTSGDHCLYCCFLHPPPDSLCAVLSYPPSSRLYTLLWVVGRQTHRWTHILQPNSSSPLLQCFWGWQEGCRARHWNVRPYSFLGSGGFPCPLRYRPGVRRRQKKEQGTAEWVSAPATLKWLSESQL